MHASLMEWAVPISIFVSLKYVFKHVLFCMQTCIIWAVDEIILRQQSCISTLNALMMHVNDALSDKQGCLGKCLLSINV